MTAPVPHPAPASVPAASCRERPLAPDRFMQFTYFLVGVAAIAQLFLLVWLNVI